VSYTILYEYKFKKEKEGAPSTHYLFVKTNSRVISQLFMYLNRKINEPNFYEKSLDSLSSGHHNLLRNGYVSGLPNSEEVYPPSSRAHVQHRAVPPTAGQSSQLMTSSAVTYCEQCTQTDVSDPVSAPQGNADRSGVGVDAKLGSSTALVQDPRFVTPPRQSFQGMASPFLSGSPTKKVQASMPDKVQEKGALLVETNQPLGSFTTAFTAAAAAADSSTLFDISSTMYQPHGVSCKKSTSTNVLDQTKEAKSITTKTCQPGGAALRSRSNSFQPIAEASPAKDVVHPMILNNDELKLLFCFLSSPDGDERDGINNLITPDTEADEDETNRSQKYEKKAALHGLYQQARDKARVNKRKKEVVVQCGQKQDGRGLTAMVTQHKEDSAKRMKQAKPMCLHGEGCTNPSVEGKGGLCIGHWHEEEMRLKEYQQFYFS